jgi:DTW domain-containing protein YfiP
VSPAKAPGRAAPRPAARNEAAVLPPGRCPRCAFPAGPDCLCPAIPALAVPYRFVILRHASEIPRMTNSGRWAAAALAGAVVVDYALGGQGTEAAPGEPPGLAPLLSPGPAALLYPSPHPARLDPPPRTIVVPDATWAQARRMVQRLAPLRRLPRLALPSSARAPAAARLRVSPVPGGMTTLEAVAGALRALGEPAAAERLDALHAAALEKTLRLKGMWPPHRNPHLAAP